MSRRNPRTVVAVIVTALALVLPLPVTLIWFNSGDSEFTGIQDLPLPGGADLGSHPYTVTAEFDDVLSLVPQSAVKVNDVAVGRVSEIEVGDDGWTARVTMEVNGKVRLPAGSYARIEQSSLLGEKYVQLIAPEEARAEARRLGGGTGLDLQPAAAEAGADDAVDIPLERTNRNPEVEEVFGALSMLLNGGGIQQLRTITRELNKTLEGNETELKSMLKQVGTLTTELDRNKGNITKALDGINRLSATLATRKEEIGAVLDDLAPGLKVLEEQRGSLVTMLRSLDKLSGTAVDVMDRSKEDMVADLKALAPVLKNLADAGQALPDSLQVLLTYPFTDAVLSGVKGDYLNAYLKVTAAPGTQIIPPIEEQSGEAPAVGGAQTGTNALPFPLPSVSPPTTSASPSAEASPEGSDSPSPSPSDSSSDDPSPSEPATTEPSGAGSSEPSDGES